MPPIFTKKKEIHDQEFCGKFLKKSSEQISSTIQSVEKDIEQTNFLLDSKQKALRDLRAKQTTNLSELKNKNQTQHQDKAKDLKERLDRTIQLKVQYGFGR